MKLIDAVASTAPHSNVYVAAVIDESTEEVFYMFEGPREALIAMATTLADHVSSTDGFSQNH
jgi:hypothetical protein